MNAPDIFDEQIAAHAQANEDELAALVARLNAAMLLPGDMLELTTISKDESTTVTGGRIVKRVVSDGAGNLGDHLA